MQAALAFPLLLAAGCLLLTPGVSPEPRASIVGGKEVPPHSRGYMALVEGPRLCAGALIKENWVLTAAHCALKGRPRVVLGAHSAAHREKYVQVFPVKRAVPYPCFDPASFEGDLQLLQLEGRATKSKAVKTLELPKTGDDVQPGTECRVAGWGRPRRNSRERAKALREANVTVIDRRTCNDVAHYDFSPVVGRGMICAGGRRGEDDSCEGDSGSPLICEGVFRGVTSFGKCGDARKPGVYILLTKKHLNWIRKTIRGAVGPPCSGAGS
ncbi:granzyme A-like [Phyllostomus hastatus]|uniref:granzyme A-like n=1 Tax=Phyllostomus hastatus TaxID=9423 RepID=UPI001E67E630|nr:granzyme A-like [Phyllostomus hastatus]